MLFAIYNTNKLYEKQYQKSDLKIIAAETRKRIYYDNNDEF